MKDVLAIVLAGGEGARLQPLTADRCKPAMPFHGNHYLVDFVLSNLVNSEIPSIYLLAQYKAQALINHVAGAWSTGSHMADQFITVVLPQGRGGTERFRGTADAVFQSIRLIEAVQPDLVAVFGADHVYRMDVRQMVAFHRASGAHATVATVPVPVQDCHHFGVLQADAQERITAFCEKPRSTAPRRGSRTHAHASMGNYIFDTDVLLRQLRRMNQTGGTDFGRDVLPAMVETHRLHAYDFTANKVPGNQGEEPAYWRDVGTIDAYFAAQFDTLGPRPKFSMANSHWPIHTVADPVGASQVECSNIARCVLGCGSVVAGGTLDGAILRSGVRVEPGAQLSDCIVLDGARIGRGAHVRRAIIDQDNQVPAGERIGIDPARDRARFTVSPGGVVVVPAGYFPASAIARAPVIEQENLVFSAVRRGAPTRAIATAWKPRPEPSLHDRQ